MNNANRHREMLKQIASALGADLCQKMAFVGGCTTGLFITDAYTLEQIRHTDDVDLIVHTIGHNSFHEMQIELRSRGFKHRLIGNDPNCAMYWGELRVDFMPDDDTLGFSNRWYSQALATATNYPLDDGITIKLVTPVYFVATKLEAYLGRGKKDPLGSQDIEDLLNLFNGRPVLIDEIRQANTDLRGYIAAQIQSLLDAPGFTDAVQDCARNDRKQEEYIYEQLEQVASWTSE